MAVREYVGARYVPKFMGQYDVTQVYEALSVVDNGAGTSYIAKIPTPAGTPLTDTTHWVVYGAASGAIFDLQSRMQVVEDDIDMIGGDISGIQSDITGLNGDISDLHDDITGLNGDISNLQRDITAQAADIKKRADRNLICIGDSYGQWTEGSTISWISQLEDRHMGSVFYHNELGGSGFLAAYYDPGEQNRKSFETLLRQLENTVTDKDIITDIVVCGGYNDWSAGHDYIANLSSAIGSFMQYARATYKNAVVSIGMIGRSTSETTCANLLQTLFPAYVDAALGQGAVYLSGVENAIKADTQMDADGFHPGPAGDRLLGRAIYNALYGSHPENVFVDNVTVSPPSSGDWAGNYGGRTHCKIYADAYGASLNFEELKLTLATPLSVEFNDTFEMTFGSLYTTFGHFFGDNYANAYVYVYTSDYRRHQVPAAVRIDDHDIKIRMQIPDGPGWLTTTVRQIVLGWHNHYIPAHMY